MSPSILQSSFTAARTLTSGLKGVFLEYLLYDEKLCYMVLLSWTCCVMMSTMIYGITIMYMMTVFTMTTKTFSLENTIEALMIIFDFV